MSLQKSTAKNSIKYTMKSFGMVPEYIGTLASYRAEWGAKVWNCVKAFEEAKISQLERPEECNDQEGG